MSPMIPVNPNDLPTEYEPMPDDITYRGVISQVTDPGKQDKNGNDYFGLKVEIHQPDEFSGRTVGDNYIAIPHAVLPEMDAKQRRRAMESGVRLGQLCKSAKIGGKGEEWSSDDFVGCEVEFTVKNEEYQGRLIPKINQYLFS